MENIINKEKNRWIRPWNITKFDDLRNHDERFFALVIKGMLAWMNDHIFLYDKPIKHFIFNTGSSYLYIESNGYEYSLNETSGEDWMHMEMPRCVVEIGNFSVPQEELTNPYTRGVYERKDGDNYIGFNAEIRRLPIEISFKLKYVLSNFNESIILLQELFDNILFQQYFKIVYLGQVVPCSIEMLGDTDIQFNKIDMTSTDTNQKTIELDVKLCTNYPLIDTRTECRNGNVIGQFIHQMYYDENEDPEINKVYGMKIKSSINSIRSNPYVVSKQKDGKYLLHLTFTVDSQLSGKDLDGKYSYVVKCEENKFKSPNIPCKVRFTKVNELDIELGKEFKMNTPYKMCIEVKQGNIEDILEFYVIKS